MRLKPNSIFFAGAIAVSLGCSSTTRKPFPPQRPTFHPEEITSKSWKDPSGAKLQFLEQSIAEFRSGKILIVKFGDPVLRAAKCVEFYLLKEKLSENEPDAYVSMAQRRSLSPSVSGILCPAYHFWSGNVASVVSCSRFWLQLSEMTMNDGRMGTMAAGA